MQVLWLRFLTEIDEHTRYVPEELQAEPEIKKALTVLEESAFTDEELYQYEKFWDIISVEKTLYSSGERKGREEGIEVGRAEGMKEGEVKGMKKVAANMKQRGMNIEDIVACTGLDEDVIRAL